MLAICIECSHKRGMGHLFRAMNLIYAVEKAGENYILLMNRDEAGETVLAQNGIVPIIVDLRDVLSDWEGRIIRERHVTVWLNDRLDTGAQTARHVKNKGIPLFTIDDMGEGAALADGNFASLIFENIDRIPGRQVYAGCEYLILNPAIERWRRRRSSVENIVVTLGGSDTYGVTLPVIAFLKNWCQENEGKRITILLGPGSVIWEQAQRAVEGTDFRIVSFVPSLMEFFAQFDLAVTGGGVTCLEAAACGLPCLVIANEPHEIQVGRYIERSGCGIFAGYFKEMHLERIHEMKDIASMSRRGMEKVSLSGAERICEILFAG